MDVNADGVIQLEEFVSAQQNRRQPAVLATVAPALADARAAGPSLGDQLAFRGHDAVVGASGGVARHPQPLRHVKTTALFQRHMTALDTANTRPGQHQAIASTATEAAASSCSTTAGSLANGGGSRAVVGAAREISHESTPSPKLWSLARAKTCFGQKRIFKTVF